MIEQPFLRSEIKSEDHREQLLLARNRISFLHTGVLFLAGYGESVFRAGKKLNFYQPYWSFQLMLKGSMTLAEPEKRKLTLKPGDFFLTRPGHHYHFEVLEDVEKRYIMVSHGVLVTLLCEQGSIADLTMIAGADEARITHVFDTIRTLALSGGEDLQRRLSGITYDFLLHLLPENAPVEFPDGLSRIIENIHANITGRFTLKDMSLQYGIGQRSLNRLFLKYLNCSPIQYVIKTRMMYARQMLQSEGLGIENIARVCGYRSCAFFIKEFKRLFSCTPGEYRKKQIISQQRVANFYSTMLHDLPAPALIPGLMEMTGKDLQKNKGKGRRKKGRKKKIPEQTE